MIEIAERNTQRMEYMWRVRERPEFYESPSHPHPHLSLSLSLSHAVSHACRHALSPFLSVSLCLFWCFCVYRITVWRHQRIERLPCIYDSSPSVFECVRCGAGELECVCGLKNQICQKRLRASAAAAYLHSSESDNATHSPVLCIKAI